MYLVLLCGEDTREVTGNKVDDALDTALGVPWGSISDIKTALYKRI